MCRAYDLHRPLATSTHTPVALLRSCPIPGGSDRAVCARPWLQSPSQKELAREARCPDSSDDRRFLVRGAAIYGVGFCDAGSRVFELLGHSGAGAVAQQLLTEPVLWLGYLCCAGIGVGCGFLTLETHDHVAGGSQPFWGCLVGFMVGWTALSCVKAGNKSIFVCYADEPSLLSQRSEAVAAFIDENKKEVPAPKVLSQVSHAQVELVKP